MIFSLLLTYEKKINIIKHSESLLCNKFIKLKATIID